jgi:glycolate oxidase iron-sulfur subunit
MNTLRDLDYSVLQQCMHCGLCLPTCPTYVETSHERHSPRGRIALLRAVADGELALSKTLGEEMYYCLGCLACTSACPAGVNYAELFETARAEVETTRVLATPQRDFTRWITLRVLFTRPRLLRFVGHALRFWRTSGLQKLSRRSGLTQLLPAKLRALEPQTPVVQPQFSHQLIRPVETPATSSCSSTSKRRRVAVLTGCVQDLIFADINRATVDVLIANACEVHTPPVQPCCGSLHAHNGDLATARDLARRQLDLFNPAHFDAIISNAGGCGSHLRHYAQLLADDPLYAARAADWSRKLRDIHEYLVEINFRHPCAQLAPAPNTVPTPPKITTYHESCHLCHGQKISAQPRAILRALPGHILHECAEATWCCGSAGIYNLTHPDTSAWLQDRKLNHLAATGAAVIATANPGCHLQLQSGLAARALDQVSDRPSTLPASPPAPVPEVVHPIVLLARAYAAEPRTPRPLIHVP